MRHDLILAGSTAAEIIASVIADLYDRQDAEGRACLLGFCHLLREPERATLNLELGKCGSAILAIRTAPEGER